MREVGNQMPIDAAHTVQSYLPCGANEHPKKGLPWKYPLVAGHRQYLHFVGRLRKPLHNYVRRCGLLRWSSMLLTALRHRCEQYQRRSLNAMSIIILMMYNYSAKKLKLRRVLQILCGAFERCSRVLL